jgi:hypothetical protein
LVSMLWIQPGAFSVFPFLFSWQLLWSFTCKLFSIICYVSGKRCRVTFKCVFFYLFIWKCIEFIWKYKK